MQINRLSVENFRILDGSREWDFPTGIIGLTGPNGVGKSTFANAMAWALFGPETLPTGKSDVVTWGAKEASVTVAFELPGGDSFSVNRWQKANGSSGASIWHDDEKVAEGLDPTTREVGRLLGVDRVGFLVSVFSRQEELAGLSSLTPANRVKTVLRLLGVQTVNQALERVRDDSRQAKRDLDAAQAGVFDWREAERRLKNLNNEITSSESQSERLLEERLALDLEVDSLTTDLVTLRNLHRDYETFVRSDQAIVAQINQASGTLRGKIDELHRLSAPADPGEPPETVPYATFVSAAADKKTAAELLENLRKSLAKGVCSACGQTLPEFDPEIHDHIAEAETRLSEMTAALAQVEKKVKASEKWQEKADAADRWVAIRGAVRREIWHEQDAYHDGSVARNLLPEVAKPDLEVAEATLAERRERLAQVREYLSFLDAKTRADEAEAVRLEAVLAQGRESDEGLEAAEKAVTTYEIAVRELGTLKDSIVTEAIPAINELASAFVSELTDGTYNELVLTPNYEIQYRNSLGELKTFDNLSGGEKDVFALALRLGIAELQAENLGVLFLDEILESLDEDRQEFAWRALEKRSKRYQQIFIVTHVEKFASRAKTAISLGA
jgi:DNA repair exonuclease SbcCD ATPase subunit